MKKKLSISDKRAEDVVISMASELGVDYENDKFEYLLKLPSEFGAGIVRAFSFDDGFGVVETDYILKKDFHFQLEKGIVHPLKIVFNLGDSFKHKFEKDNKYENVNFSETIIVSSVPNNNHLFVIPRNSKSNLFTLEINRKMFERRIVDFLDEMDEGLADLFRDVNGVLPFAYKGSYSYEIAKMIQEFRNCNFKGMSRHLYLESKAYEIFSSFIEQYLDDLNRPDERTLFRNNHINNIRQTAEYIRENMETPLTIPELSKVHGLNTNVLQNGFRSIYGMSVNEFIQNERLLKIRELLMESDLNISQIMYRVGLNSKSYVSKIFSEKYGMSPSAYRHRYKSNKKMN